jgi:hypothetical protein
VLLRVGRPPAPSGIVIRREHAPYESDDHDTVLAIRGEAVDVPPSVAALRDLCIEARYRGFT